MLNKDGHVYWLNSTPVPDVSYFQLPGAVMRGLQLYISAYDKGELRQESVQEQMLELPVTIVDVLLTVLLVYCILRLRHSLTTHVLQPYANSLGGVPELKRRKLPEIAWKMGYHTACFLYGVWAVAVRRPQWLSEPPSIWTDWYHGMPIPPDLYVLYIVQFAWYLHSLYATVALDERTKDFVLMMAHHVLTLALIGLSFGARLHQCGVLVMLTHDVNDIFMLFWKGCLILRHQTGPGTNNTFAFYDNLANLAIMLFAVSWFYSRLVLYPTTVIRACFHDIWHVFPAAELPQFWIAFACMLLILLAMNAYWFSFFPWGLLQYIYHGVNEDYVCEEVDTEQVIMDKKNG